MIADDISSLKSLHDKFDNIKQEKGNRKQAEKELQQSLDALYVELKKRETNFIKSNLKARLKIMMECKEWEKKLKSGTLFFIHHSIQFFSTITNMNDIGF